MILATLVISSINLALFVLLGLAAVVSSRQNKVASQQALLALIANAQQTEVTTPDPA